jgi:TatD DNase family protein
MIDTHAHVYAEEFDADRDEVMTRAREAGVSRIVLANVDEASLSPLIQTCRQYPDLCVGTIGLHPTEVRGDYAEVLERVRSRFGEYPFCAVGEIGLDLYWDKTYRDEQLRAFDEQLLWAHDLNLPVIIHVRDAFDDLHQVLAARKSLALRGIIHSFSGTADDARRIFDYGDYYIGINGIVTFKKSALPDVVRTIGAERLVVETDAPYLAPVPHRGRRNEPAYVASTLRCVADALGRDEAEIEAVTIENAKRLFGI